MHWLNALRDRWRRVWTDEPWPTVVEEQAEPASEPPVAREPAAEPGEPETAEPISLERFADRLLEDERARSNLTDDEFQPLLDWALDTLERVVSESAHQPGDVGSRAEGATSAIRGLLATVNDAFADRSGGNPAELASRLHSLLDAVGPPIVRPERVEPARRRIEETLAGLAGRGGPVGGAELTRRLAEALGAVSGQSRDPSA